MLTNKEAEECFRCVREHLSDSGRFILDIVHPHPSFLFKSEKQPVLVMDFKDASHNDIVEIYETCTYNSETEICDIAWEYRYQKLTKHNKRFEYQMRMYYPDTINRMLVESGFHIIDVFGDYNRGALKEASALQIYYVQ